jgi:UDP-glucose:(heptosyl)LPS alpha-1,3-glucosyltransferase
MRIGVIRRGYSRTGGAEAYLQRFADGLFVSGHEVVLFTEKWPSADWPHARVGIDSHSPKGFADSLRRRTPGMKCDLLFSLERVWSCDVYRAGDGVHAAWLKRRARYEPFWKPWLRHFNKKHREMLALEKHLFSPLGARMVIANSEMVKREIKRHFDYPADQIHVVRNGVPPFTQSHGLREDLRRKLRLDKEDYAILFAGSGWERKGLRFAIKAVNAAGLPQLKLLVAGRGHAGSQPRSSSVRYLGAVQDMAGCYAAADAFILPTIYEPFSNACLEALAAGLPVITTAQNGFSEIIESGVEGEVVKEASDVAALAAAIRSWQDPDRRALVLPRLMELSAQYSIEENVRQTLALVAKAI